MVHQEHEGDTRRTRNF